MNPLQRFYREEVTWEHLRHPNALPLLEVTVSGRRFAMSSEWMENGNINYFVGRDRHVNRIELVRHPPMTTFTKPYRCAVQLVDVVNGLMHMHGPGWFMEI